MDFGLARATDFETTPIVRRELPVQLDAQSSDQILSQPLTQVGAMIGTIAYMAPEHFQSAELDEKTDQFSFCVTLFEALYGERPFSGDTLEQFEENVTCGRMQIPKGANVPDWISAIVQRGLSVSKKDRYHSIAELLDDLGHDPVLAKSQRRKKQILVLVMVVAAVFIWGLAYLFFDRSEVCTGAVSKVASIWDSEKKETIRQAFAKTGLSYSGDSFMRVHKRLEAYLEKWKNLYTEICLATRVRGEQSEELMDLKIECLDGQLKNVQALATVFAQADRVVVERSVQAVESLSNLVGCLDTDSLRKRIKAPEGCANQKQGQGSA